MEYFDILDENGIFTGITKERSQVHRDGDWHREVYIWVINKKDKILLQRRSPEKKSYPNMITGSCAGHISSGEDSKDGAKRELKEELDLDINLDELKFIKTIKNSSSLPPNFVNNKFSDVYIVRTEKDIADMKPQEGEVSEIFWVSYKELKQMINNNYSDILNTGEFDVLFEELEEELER